MHRPLEGDEAPPGLHRPIRADPHRLEDDRRFRRRRDRARHMRHRNRAGERRRIVQPRCCTFSRARSAAGVRLMALTPPHSCPPRASPARRHHAPGRRLQRRDLGRGGRGASDHAAHPSGDLRARHDGQPETGGGGGPPLRALRANIVPAVPGCTAAEARLDCELHATGLGRNERAAGSRRAWADRRARADLPAGP